MEAQDSFRYEWYDILWMTFEMSAFSVYLNGACRK